MSPERKSVIRQAQSLAELLADPQPGLSTWHARCEAQYQMLLVCALRAVAQDIAEKT